MFVVPVPRDLASRSQVGKIPHHCPVFSTPARTDLRDDFPDAIDMALVRHSALGSSVRNDRVPMFYGVTRVDLGQDKIETADGGVPVWHEPGSRPEHRGGRDSPQEVEDFTEAKLERSISEESFAFRTG